jgi:hypothetical protein
MRFETITKRVNAFNDSERAAGRGHQQDAIASRVDYVLYQAIQNAEDTATERSMTEAEYKQVALNSLEVLLAGSPDADVQAWYRKQGFAW